MRVFLCSILLLLVPCFALFAADFTVDERSLLHVGASGTIGYAIDRTLYNHREINRSTPKERIFVSGTVCLVPGAFKEFVLDSHHDWGDMFFNGAGCYGLPYVNEKLGGWQVSAERKDNTTVVVITVRK
jgi:hypothetical protein